MALSAAECQKMVDAARSNGVKLGVAYYRRFYPKIVRVRQLLDEGRIGDIILVRIAHRGFYAPKPDDPKAWRLEKAKSGGGPMLDIGSHRLDLFCHLFGLPAAVMGKAETLTQSWEVEDTATMLMKLQTGGHALANFTWNTRAGCDEFEIAGVEGTLSLTPLDGPDLSIVMGNGSRHDETLPKHANVHLPLIEDFAAAVLQEKEPVVTGEEGAKTTKIIDAVFASTEAGAEVKLA